jgi:hypothetical protein
MNILGYTGPKSKREIVQIDQPASGSVENPLGMATNTR